MTSSPSQASLRKGSLLRTAVAILGALAVSMYFFAPTALSQTEQEVEESFSADVQTSGESELAVSANGVEESETIGSDASGEVEALVTTSADTADELQVSLSGCPEDRAGGVITVSGLDADAEVEGVFTGEATVEGETQQVDQSVGPVQAGPDGEAAVSLCASAEAGAEVPQEPETETPGVPEDELPGAPEEGDAPEAPVEPGDLLQPPENEVPGGDPEAEVPQTETPTVPGEASHSVEVTAEGQGAELCASVDDEEECVDVGSDASGELTADVAATTETPDHDVAVEECPDDQTGAVLALSGLEPGATVEGGFTGEATVGGETQQVDESVGPVEVDATGDADVSLCASAEGGPEAPETPEAPDGPDAPETPEAPETETPDAPPAPEAPGDEEPGQATLLQLLEQLVGLIGA